MHEILTQDGVEREEKTEPMNYTDGVSHPVVSMNGPNLIFAKPHDHLDGNEVAASNETKHQEIELVSEKLDRGGKSTPPDALPLSSDPAITKPNGKPTWDLARWTHRTQQSPIRAAGVQVGEKGQLLISHDTGGYLGWSEVSEINGETYGQMDDNIQPNGDGLQLIDGFHSTQFIEVLLCINS